MTSGATIEGFKLCVPDFPYCLRAAKPSPWVHPSNACFLPLLLLNMFIKLDMRTNAQTV